MNFTPYAPHAYKFTIPHTTIHGFLVRHLKNPDCNAALAQERDFSNTWHLVVTELKIDTRQSYNHAEHAIASAKELILNSLKTSMAKI